MDPVLINNYEYKDDKEYNRNLNDEWAKNIILPEEEQYHKQLIDLKKEDFIVGAPV